MKSGERQSEWEARCADGRTAWDRGEASPALTRWLADGTIPEGRILVPGCGHGHEVATLIRAGRFVTAVDIAMQPVMHLMGELAVAGLHAQVVQADLLQWQPAEPFNAVYEQTCLCALEPATWPDYEQCLADWLLPGGKLLALFMQTGREGGPPYHCAMPDMRTLFDERRWRWLGGEPETIPHPNGFVELGYVLERR